MEYKIVSINKMNQVKAINQLEEDVNKMIKEGWRPQGGMSLLSQPIGIASQAMIREEPGD